MFKADYDPDKDGLVTAAEPHKTSHQAGGGDEISAAGLTGVPVAPLLADGIAGRVLRFSELYIHNGTDDTTLKCQLLDHWNGDAIAETDNIAKGATTGDFSFSADGKLLTIEASGLSGNALAVFGTIYFNYTFAPVNSYACCSANDILISIYDHTAGDYINIEELVNTGSVYLSLLYITDA